MRRNSLNNGHENRHAEGREMNRRGLTLSARYIAAPCAVAALAACTPKAPPAPPPPPPVAIVIPPKPYPPLGAAPNLVLPPLAADGTRLTVNTALSSKQALWNLRSAYNVAALNCQSPQHVAMAKNYATFLKSNKKLLAGVYKDLDSHFKQVHGAGYIQKREVYQTQVYNYFAFPPVRPSFCDAMLTVGLGLSTVPTKSLEAQAPLELAKLEKLYQDFYVSYGKYRSDLAAWEAQYGGPASSLTSAAPTTAQP